MRLTSTGVLKRSQPAICLEPSSQAMLCRAHCRPGLRLTASMRLSMEGKSSEQLE